MKPPLHYLLYRVGLITCLAVTCGFGLSLLLNWEGLLQLPTTVGQWLGYLVDLV